LKLLTHPGVAAVLASTLAVAVHPALPFGLLTSEAGTIAVAAVALLLALAYVARALHAGLAERVQALGAVALVAGLAFDGARAHRGLLTVDLGHAKTAFEEEADGRASASAPGRPGAARSGERGAGTRASMAARSR
jgi:hypothetical protein